MTFRRPRPLSRLPGVAGSGTEFKLSVHQCAARVALVAGLFVSCAASTPPPVAAPKPPAPLSATTAKTHARPRLILQVTVDQLSPRYFDELGERLGERGFRRLLDEGTVYENARHRHAITETAPGHASLFTGTDPAQHGIVSNSWMDERGREISAVFDAEYPLLGIESTGRGASPQRLLVPTWGDRLVECEPNALVYAVSVKDRGAILPAGKRGKAFWYEDGLFVSSRYYFEELPPWVNAFNDQDPTAAYLDRAWDLLEPRERYIRRDRDQREYEGAYLSLGSTFPHALPEVSESDAASRRRFAGALKVTPFGDEMTKAFLERLLASTELGLDEVPDLLSVSFSSTDYVGHFFGPESLEAEDNFVRLDALLARLLDEVEKRVGRDRLLVVLSADHGANEAPEALMARGVSAGRIDPEELRHVAVQALLPLLRERGLSERAAGERAAKLVRGVVQPYVWLDREALGETGLDAATAEQSISSALAARSDIRLAMTRTELTEERGARGTASEAPAGALGGSRFDAVQDEGPGSEMREHSVAAGEDEAVRAAVTRAFHPDRSGDVYLVPEPGYLIPQSADFVVTHGTPWNHDAAVPLVFWGADVPASRITERVEPTMIAPLLMRRLGLVASGGGPP